MQIGNVTPRGTRCTLAWVVLALVACSEAPPSAPRPPDVVLLVADTLRADHLGAWGYPLDTSPHLDALAREALRFELAISPAPWTSPSIASLFTGVDPTAHGVMTGPVDPGAEGGAPSTSVLGEELTTLAESFRAAGYATWAVTGNAWVSEQLGFAQGFDRFLTFDYQPARTLTDAALGLVAEHTGDGPFFLYVQYMDAHAPYATDCAAQLQLPVRPAREVRFGRVLARYDRAIRCLDESIGELVEGLAARGRWSETVVAFVGDHGEQFGERGSLGHGFAVHAEETHVPMWIRAPGLRGSFASPVSLMDLYATILAAAGLPVPDGVQARSLLDEAGRARREAEGVLAEGVFGERGPNRKAFVSKDRLRLVLEFPGASADPAPRHEKVVGVWDAAADPLEQHPLASSPRTDELVAGFYAAHEESLRLRVEPERRTLDPETLERLRALGYVD